MSDQITNKILESYGFKGAQPQFKSIIYPIEQLKHSIEDHQLKQISPELQQILESERAREMVQKRGITLDRTKEFFQEKIKEYNAIIDLQHLRSGQSYVTPKKDNVFKRHTADQGEITNYHFVLNWQNLNLVFDEIENSNKRGKSQLQSRTPDQSSSQISKPQISIKTTNKKGGLVNRLDKKFNDYDTKMSQSIATNLPESRRFSMFLETPQQKINRRNSLNPQAVKKYVKFHNFMRTVNVLTNKPEEKIESENRQDLIKTYINDAFNKERQPTDVSQRERAKSQQENRKRNKQMLEQFNQLNQTCSIQHQTFDIMNNDIPIYDDIQFKSVDHNQIKQNQERRNRIVQSVNSRMQPKYIHLGGSRYAVKNNFSNQQNYQQTINTLLVNQIKEEFKKLKSFDDGIDLEVLEGPPKKIDYHSSNLNQDYNDVKVSKIVQKMKR
ncbi:unnamed protein product [Paramecium pentaurelia]|uniref:Uncharacterized protein n=1 Tax=Paramecium pentaurelia TaxID=43138 RepID=A0A8S1XWX7_9CILI|nr:unnamed protein product [Paramecium pentaurelia]